MAYVIGRKTVKDTSEFSSDAYGIDLDFKSKYTSEEQAKENLRNLLLTAKGERLLQPEFGTGLKALLFEPIDEGFETRIRDVITESVNFWLPYITIDDIEVVMTPELTDKNQVGVNLQFRVGNQVTTNEITLNVQG